MCRLLCVALLLALLASIAAATDYCRKSLCDAGQKHIGCNNDGSMKSQCGELLETGDKKLFYKAVLKQHNEFRNEIAKGNFHGFTAASRMATMQWDEELQRISEFALTECQLVKHKCIATDNFKRPGQNDAYNKFRTLELAKNVAHGQVYMWIDEYRFANMESLLSGESTNRREIGHFLQIITDSADRIGCSYLKMKKDDWYYQFIVCTYSVGFQKGKIAYRPGKLPGQDCKTGSNPEYINLCSPKEIYEKDYKDENSANKKNKAEPDKLDGSACDRSDSPDCAESPEGKKSTPPSSQEKRKNEPPSSDGQGKIEPTSSDGQGKIEPPSSDGQGKIEPTSSDGQGKIEPPSSDGQGKKKNPSPGSQGKKKNPSPGSQGKIEKPPTGKKKHTSTDGQTKKNPTPSDSDVNAIDSLLDWLKKADPNKGMKLEVKRVNETKLQKDSLKMELKNPTKSRNG